MEHKNQKRPLRSISPRKITFSLLALVSLFFAAYPTFRSWLFPTDVVIGLTLKEPGQAVKSNWCASCDGIYDAYLMFPVTPGKDLVAILGRGGYSSSGEYRITEKGVDIPLMFAASQDDVKYTLDVSNVHPTTSWISRETVGRYVGRLRLLRGCYQSMVSIGEIPESLRGLDASVVLRLYEPTSAIGKMTYSIFEYSAWAAAVIYRVHLRPVL